MNLVSQGEINEAIDSFAALLKRGVYGAGMPFTEFLLHERPEWEWVTPPRNEHGLKQLPRLCHA